ncbi:MAG: AsmA family protein [Candidatus Omnitrophica bacterium]|nr:AsmA family protein [Candidatus Omnitrophota bacterium]
MRIILLSLFVFFVLIFAGFFVFLKTFDADQYLPPITQHIAQAIHRRVSIAHAALGFHFVKGLSLDLKTLTIDDDPYFSRQNFLTVDSLHLGLDLMPLLFKREIHVTHVIMTALKVSIIRSRDGQMNVQTIGRSPSTVFVSQSSKAVIPSSTLASAGALPALLVKSIFIDHARVSFEDQNPQLPVHIVIQDIEAKVNDFSFTEPFDFTATSAGIGFKAHLRDLLTAPKYDFQLQIKGMRFEDLFDESAWPVVLKGQMTGQFLGSGQSFEPQAMLNNLKGEGELALADARIEKLNILQIILNKLNIIPGLADQIEAALSSSIKDKLGSDTTVLDKAQTKVKVENKIISIQDAKCESKIFSLTAQGSLGFDLAANIDVKTYLAPDLSDDLVHSVKPLKGLLDDQKRLLIPGRVSGQGSSMGYQLDVAYITKKVALSEGVEQINGQLEKVLNKNPTVKNILNAVLGGQSQPDHTEADNPDSSESQPANTEDQTQEQPTKKLLNNILNNILR